MITSPPTKEMIVSDEKTSDSKRLKLVPELNPIWSLEDINMVKPGKIIIKGKAVSGCGREIERLEISLDRWKSWVEASGNQDKKSACMSFEAEATIDDDDDDVSQSTIDVIAKEIKVRAIVRNYKPLSSSSEQQQQQQMLVPDLIRSVLERLSFAEFHTARSISSDWYSNAESCTRQSPTPWLILFSTSHDHLDDNINNVSCKLFDPHENKTYIVRDLGLGFHNSRCLANSGSWFLMLDHRTNFYLLNLFTRDRIRLPSLESIDGCQMRLERVSETDFLVNLYYESSGNFSCGQIRKIRIGNAVLWVDERSRDYFVVWNLDCFFAYHKKGDHNKSWKVFQPLKNQGCVHMVFKESKLYVLSLSRNITVYDFSGGGDDAPKECASFPYQGFQIRDKQHFNDLALTLSGEVLIIAGRVKLPEICYFDVYKMDPQTSKWIKTSSLENEALFLDLGTTVAAEDGLGKNCIYFSNDQFHRYNGISICSENSSICVYNIQTNKVVQRFPHLAASSPKLFKDARWFFPTFGGKWLL
ncbi:hypothetical protein EUTSA_v10022303mg [Eutrema salsugineum]|uniref:F-box domain-containing protein n=1 Tax=Eutrema salsugineum TaxID=72664 RepID=V4LGT0_EUTSA|nr:hypothetical protein EUTSA_v10022303mg [Eutrema salsugineum]